ncbi:MAG: D-alanyl-D-alanine carboxypeptidase/D-alanyl-D-alanine-endopeptidase [Pseudomonadota bacterium]|nr:D-alanyl-D-alanine carboxypeptidase/D-alanyl-D-alanine-endopeptidase [Pseudomonadota bacterium]
MSRFLRSSWLSMLVLGISSNAQVPDIVGQAMLEQRIPPDGISFSVVDPDSGRAVAGLNPDTPRSPASTVKAVTTFATLDALGPAFVWHTRAAVHGNLHDGLLDGELVLQGGGDPYMSLERWWNFARRLRGTGLKAIRGAIRIDDTAFSLPASDPGAFDQRPNRTYNAVPNALMVNFQSVEFTLLPNPARRRVDVSAAPAPANLIIENHVRLTSGPCANDAAGIDMSVRSEKWDRVALIGEMSGVCEPRRLTRVVLRPADFAFGTFVALWRELGGRFEGSLVVGATPQGAREILSYDSLTLGEIVRLTNKYSSNLMARHLLLTLGGERFGLPATQEKSAAALAEWTVRRGLPLQEIDIDNGSGLSRATRISAAQMTALLAAAYHSLYAPEFLASLPLAGMDGTLRTRMTAAPAGSVRLKTGHIDGVSAVAGYVTTQTGKTWVLASFVNDARADAGAGEPVHEALVNWIQKSL